MKSSTFFNEFRGGFIEPSKTEESSISNRTTFVVESMTLLDLVKSFSLALAVVEILFGVKFLFDTSPNEQPCTVGLESSSASSV